VNSLSSEEKLRWVHDGGTFGNGSERWVDDGLRQPAVALAYSSSARGGMASCSMMGTALLICRCRAGRFLLRCGGCLNLLHRCWEADGGVGACSSAPNNKEVVLGSLSRHGDDLLNFCLH
jgi:hypothetical protein